jgi:5-methylcytosine-specific restriction enzyme B
MSVIEPAKNEISDIFGFILDNYFLARKNPQNPEYRKEINSKFSQLKTLLRPETTKSAPTIKLDFGIGIGNMANVPWLAFLDSRITDSTQTGFYAVYLFKADMSGFYLTLNQGVGRTASKPPTKTRLQEVQINAQLLRPQINWLSDFGFSLDDSIDLADSGSTGKAYEKSTIAYKYYSRKSIPSDIELLGDLKRILRAYQDCITDEVFNMENPQDTSDNRESIFSAFYAIAQNANLMIDADSCLRFIALLCTKPFVILTGLSGSGKTKLAQAFSKWICADTKQFCMIPVGADWTNREPLLGYPNALEPGKYIKPENGVLDLLIEVSKPENSNKPYFLILDEMNLSHVERYFADFLSAMESAEPIPLHPDDDNWKENGEWKDEIPNKISLPRNLFIIGTVNVDETTYMFSPKVLDRAGVIEFRVSEAEMNNFLQNPVKPEIDQLTGRGAGMAADFVERATKGTETYNEASKLNNILIEFFSELKKTGAEFGYRTASEIFRFANVVHTLSGNDVQWPVEWVADAAIMQKLLPKVHGSRRKLEPVLSTLISLCLTDRSTSVVNEIMKPDNENLAHNPAVRFPISLEKLRRMHQRIIQDGFTSFAEA